MDTLTIDPTTGEIAERPVHTYVAHVNRLFTAPAKFFREMPFNVAESLSFGIVSAWVASFISFFIDTVNSLLLARLFEGWVQKILATDQGFSLFGLSSFSFAWAAGTLILGPFFFLARILFGSTVLYIFSLLLIEENEAAPERVSYRGILRIQSVAFAAHWLSVVPVFGPLIAFIARLVLIITGVRERFRVSTKRATVVVLAPYFFLALFLVLVGLLLALILMQLPYQEFLDMKGEGWEF